MLIVLILTILFTCLIDPSTSYAPQSWNCTNSPSNLTESPGFNTSLTSALSSLTAMASSKPFYNVTVGSIESNRVYALYSCQHDLPPYMCQSCVENATKDVFDYCYPSAKEGIIFDKECILRYSDRMIFSTMELEPYTNDCGLLVYNTHTIEVKTTIEQQFEGLIDEATKSPDNFAVGSVYNSVLRDTFYLLAQCTPDITKEKCNECLSHALNVTVQSCGIDGRLLGYTIGPSCLVRYDTDMFYYTALKDDLPPVSSTLFNTKKEDSGLVTFGKVCLGLLIGILFLAILFIKLRRACC